MRRSMSRIDSRYSSSFRRSGVLTCRARSRASASTSSRIAAVEPAAGGVADEQVEDARGVDLLGRRLRVAGPRDARAVDHREAVFQSELGRLDAEDEARDGGLRADRAGRGPGPSTGRRGSPSWSVLTQAPESRLAMRPRCGLLCRDGLLVEQALEEDHVLAEGLHRLQAGADLHRGAGALAPTSAPAPRRWRSRRRRTARGARAGPSARPACPSPRPARATTPARAGSGPAPPPPRRKPRRLTGRSPADSDRSVISALPDTPRLGATAHSRSLVSELLAGDDPHDQVREAAPRARPSVICSINGRSETISARPSA